MFECEIKPYLKKINFKFIICLLNMVWYILYTSSLEKNQKINKTNFIKYLRFYNSWIILSIDFFLIIFVAKIQKKSLFFQQKILFFYFCSCEYISKITLSSFFILIFYKKHKILIEMKKNQWIFMEFDFFKHLQLLP